MAYITTYVKQGKYSIEAEFRDAGYYKSYLPTITLGHKWDFTFKSYK